jgi:signal transduction histidine kinase
MFYRTSDHSTGSGLGLYIVKETIKKLGGSIEVESEVNQGTQFIIQLPAHY